MYNFDEFFLPCWRPFPPPDVTEVNMMMIEHHPLSAVDLLDSSGEPDTNLW